MMLPNGPRAPPSPRAPLFRPIRQIRINHPISFKGGSPVQTFWDFPIVGPFKAAVKMAGHGKNGH